MPRGHSLRLHAHPSLQPPSLVLETHLMDTRMPSHGRFGLWYNRPTNREHVGFAEDSDSDESFRQRQCQTKQEMKANRRLNELNRKVREAIDTRLWATMYLRYLTKRIHTTAPACVEFTDLPDIQNLSLGDGIPAPSPEEDLERPFQGLTLELQLQILERRLKDAHLGVKAIWAALNELIDELASEISEYPPDNCIGFRVFNSQSQARLFLTGDIRCGKWQEFDVNRGLTRAGAEKHIICDRCATDYISISTSPQRLWRLVSKWGHGDQEIAVIDLRVLQRLGIGYGSTTDDLGFSNNGENRTEYATKHHVLVVGWIPRRSVLGFLSKGDFSELLEETQMTTAGEADDISPIEYDRKIPFELISRRLNATAKMMTRSEVYKDIEI